LQTNKSKLEQAIRTVSAIENEIEQGKNAIQRKTELENNLKEKLKKISLLDKLCVAFSKNGIPASIIATILPEIEQIANMFLDKMSHGRLQLAFKTTEKQKNGNEKDTLEIEVFDGQEWRRFESFSGGEQFRISLSIRLALSKVLARRANIDLELLILDEAATSLDSTGRDEFVEIVMSLRNEFSRIILMSHIPELASNFDNQINLYRSINGTKIAS
jgi:exonuclease SbcC